MTQADHPAILGLDIGSQRTGVAIVNNGVAIARPYITLDQPDQLVAHVKDIVRREACQLVVVGLPRNLQGDATAQTDYVKKVARQLAEAITVPIEFIDEALTSVKAEAELTARRSASKADVDMLAATYILEDYLARQPSQKVSHAV